MGNKSKYPWSNNNKKELLGYTPASRAGWYNKKVWRDTRCHVLANEPLCRLCTAKGRVTPAVLVDHITALTGTTASDWFLFLDLDNLQPLCQKCHRAKTRADNSKYSDENRLRGLELMKKLEN